MIHALHAMKFRIGLLAAGPALGFLLGQWLGSGWDAALMALAGCLAGGGLLVQPLAARLERLALEVTEARAMMEQALAAQQDRARGQAAMHSHAEDFAAAVSAALGMLEAETARLHAAAQHLQPGEGMAREAAELRAETAALRTEAEGFLHGLREAGPAADRRRFERYPAGDAPVTLRSAGEELAGWLHDVSLAGCACRTPLRAAVGTELEVILPDADGPVLARVCRAQDGVLGLMFRPGLETLARLNPLMGRLGIEV